jgi:ribosomal protein L37AE/L43A
MVLMIREGEMEHTRPCLICGAEVNHERWRIGYKMCMPCGESAAKSVRRTIAPMHKSNYMLITDLADLRGLNNKGGLVK